MSNKGRAVFSFCAFHFIDDGFTDLIYLLLPYYCLRIEPLLQPGGALERGLLRIDEPHPVSPEPSR